MSSSLSGLDVVEEFRLRRWARENYVAEGARDPGWHAVVLDEMWQKEQELSQAASQRVSGALVPLHPEPHAGSQPRAHSAAFLMLHGPHVDTVKAEVLLKVPSVAN